MTTISILQKQIVSYCFSAVVLMLFYCSALGAEELDEKAREDLKKPAHLQDLAYGQILYDYYRGDEITALTHILIAQKKKLLPNHANSAELLSGVIYLNLGLVSKAQTIFNRLLTEEDLKNELLAKLEFYLAKLHYKQDDYPQAKIRLSKIYASLEVDLKDESLIMLSNIALADDDLPAAREWLSGISSDSELLAYSRYNLGILWLKDGQLEESLPFLTKVFITDEPTDVQRSLQDKAKVALGFYYLKEKQFDRARDQFLSVRLGSAYTNKALLGMGWTYVEKGDFNKALSHWLELRKKDIRDIAVQEALLAIPFAYQKLDAMKPALAKYLDASNKYQQQIDLIIDIENQVSEGNLVENLVLKLVRAKSLGDGDESIQDSKLFGDVYDYYIYELLAQNRFNEGFRSYQKLGRLAFLLDYWEEQLPMFSEMLLANELRFNEKIPQIDTYLEQGVLEKYQANYGNILNDLTFLNKSEKLHLLATSEETLIHKRLIRLEATIQKIPANMLTDNQLEKTRRARGVLQWQFEVNKTAKMRELNKAANEISFLLDEMTSRSKTLGSARENALTRFVGYQDLVDEGTEKLRSLREKIRMQISIQASLIKQQILEVLKRRKLTLEHFLLQSDLSVARLHEKAVLIPEID